MLEGDKDHPGILSPLRFKIKRWDQLWENNLSPDRRAFIQQKVSEVCKMSTMFSTTFSEEQVRSALLIPLVSVMGSALQVSWNCCCLSLGARPAVCCSFCSSWQGAQSTPAPPQLCQAHRNTTGSCSVNWLCQIATSLLELPLLRSEGLTSGKWRPTEDTEEDIKHTEMCGRISLHPLPGPSFFPYSAYHSASKFSYPECILLNRFQSN